MRTNIAALLLISLALFSKSASAQEAVYNFQTGNITFSGVEGDLGLTLFAPEAEFRRDEATDLQGHPFSKLNPSNIRGSISWANFGGFPAGELDAGNLLVPGTDPALLRVQRQVSFTLVLPMPIQAINLPEPGTLLLAVLGAMGCFVSFPRR